MSERAIISACALTDMAEKAELRAEIERLRGLLAALKANLARVVEAGDELLFWAARFEEAGAAVAAYDDARGAAKKEEG